MGNDVGEFMAHVQQHLAAAGVTASLSIDEQDIVKDFAEQELGAQQCARRIAEERGHV
jgi:hypothetical protein